MNLKFLLMTEVNIKKILRIIVVVLAINIVPVIGGTCNYHTNEGFWVNYLIGMAIQIVVVVIVVIIAFITDFLEWLFD